MSYRWRSYCIAFFLSPLSHLRIPNNARRLPLERMMRPAAVIQIFEFPQAGATNTMIYIALCAIFMPATDRFLFELAIKKPPEGGSLGCLRGAWLLIAQNAFIPSASVSSNSPLRFKTNRPFSRAAWTTSSGILKPAMPPKSL